MADMDFADVVHLEWTDSSSDLSLEEEKSNKDSEKSDKQHIEHLSKLKQKEETRAFLLTSAIFAVVSGREYS